MGDPIKRIEHQIQRRARRSVFRAFLASATRMGGGTVTVIDGDGKKFTYKEISRAAFALGGPVARMTNAGDNVGIMLPTGAGAAIAFFAVQSRGRVPAMINFTAGARNLKTAGRAGEITKVLTAHKFIEIAKLEGLIEELKDVFEFVYLEDLKESLTAVDKARALIGPILPSLIAANPHPDSDGVILFTSGTEGDPKGVVLSHANILANIEQIAQHVDIAPTDIFFNALPVFHCYGLTAGTLWPMIVGYPVVLHPSPLHTKIIPKRVFETDSTVMFSTDTFLNQYMRASDEGGMNSLRLAVCGAERVRDETRQAAERQFSFQVLEGYGVTEGSPVLAANQPGDIRGGTVGKMLPGIETRLVPVEGLENAGRLFVRGPNIMKGYITPDQPRVLKPLADGWHDTGDVVSIDEDGYVTIRGRLKRFAKIAGEMVSLGVVENCASAVWPDNMHAAAILPDPRKGEQIVLISDKESADRATLLSWAQSHGVPEIAVPKKIIFVDEVPVLGTGKMDYVGIEKLAKEGLAALEAERTAEPAPTKSDLKKQQKKKRTERQVEATRLATEAKERANLGAAKSEPAVNEETSPPNKVTPPANDDIDEFKDAAE